MYKCPNKNLPEWKELEKVVPEVAYTIWDMNNGHGIDKAPNGEPSILFNKLLEHFNNDREQAILQKAKIFSNRFQNNINNYTLDENSEPYIQDVLTTSSVSYDNADFKTFTEDEIRVLEEISNLYTKIQKGLKDRLNAIKRYSSKNPKVWRDLQNLIQKLSTSETEQGIIQFLEHVRDSINDSKNFLSKPIEEINAKQIRQLSNDYVGFYKPLIDNIQYIVDTTDIFKGIDNYDDVVNLVAEMSQSITTVNNKFINVLKSKGYQYLRQYLSQQGMPDSFIQGTINWLDDPKHDSSIFMNWFGMATNSDNAVQQAIAKMLNDVKNATDRQTLEVGIRLVKALNKAKEKYGNDVQKLLYEKDDDGSYTGYRVTRINQGKYNRTKKQFLDKLAKQLGITKDSNGQYELPLNQDIQKKWFDSINKWYNDHADRKYVSEYYTLRNKMLSQKTRDAQQEIQNYIDNITNPITIDGIEYDNLLSASEYNQLQELRKQKKMLANPYNLDGSEKTGDDALIAKELIAFNEEVSKHIKYDTDIQKYQADRSKVAKRYGDNSEQLKLWEERNTVERYNQAFYDRIDSLDKTPQSDTYERLRTRRRNLLSLYKDPNTGKINTDAISDAEKRDLLQLDQDIASSYSPSQDTERKGPRLSDFAEIATTEQYRIDMEKARNNGTLAYNDWFNRSHYEDIRGFMRPASFYTELRPLPQFMDQYKERVPSIKYSSISPSSDWYNSNWDPNGPSIQPNKSCMTIVKLIMLY